VKKEGSNGADNNARSRTREAEVKLTEQRHGLGGTVGWLVGIGMTALLLFVLSPDLAFGDPPPEATPTHDGVPAPQKNSSGFDRLIEAYTSVIRDTPNSTNAYALRGATKYAKGDLEGALADVEQALMLDPIVALPWVLERRSARKKVILMAPSKISLRLPQRHRRLYQLGARSAFCDGIKAT
jgi:tetratricopeptide (TPR) repeat protein